MSDTCIYLRVSVFILRSWFLGVFCYFWNLSLKEARRVLIFWCSQRKKVLLLLLGGGVVITWGVWGRVRVSYTYLSFIQYVLVWKIQKTWNLWNTGGRGVVSYHICCFVLLFFGNYFKRLQNTSKKIAGWWWCLIIFVGSGSYFLVNMHKIRKNHNSICVWWW